MLQNLRKITAHRILMLASLLWVFADWQPLANAQVLGRDTDKPRPDYPGLDIQVVAGWDGRVEMNAPVPVSFLISNQSDQVLEGQLILTDPYAKKEINLGDVFVGPASVKRFSSVQALTGWNDCVATYTDGYEVFWTRPVSLVTGKDFSEDVNFLLFVDDSGRALQLPNADQAEPAEPSKLNAAQPGLGGPLGMPIDPSRYIPQPGRGRPVQPLSVKTWQIPQHPGPLTVTQGILFPESIQPDNLNEQQWDAIGRWMCLGGTVFLHESSKEVLDRLKKAAPLTVLPSVSWEGTSLHRCGGGSIREYSGNLFSADNAATVTTVLEAAGRLSRTNVLSMIDETSRQYLSSSNADKTRMMVIAVLGIYTVFSGVVTLLLFRMNRRRVAIYIGSVVTIGCIATAVLGGILRTSRGDLYWHSITQASTSGVTQVAEINVQSAGGRNTSLAVNGKQADLQLLDNTDWFGRGRKYDPNYGYNNYNYTNGNMYYDVQNTFTNATGYPAFTQQQNLLADTPEAFRVRVPITPWGFRRSEATAFDSSLNGLDVKLSYVPEEGASTQLLAMGNAVISGRGQWSIAIENRLPCDLTECRLVLMTSQVEVSTQSQNNNLIYSRTIQNPMPSIRIWPAYSTITLENLPASASRTMSPQNIAFQVQRMNDQSYGSSNANTNPVAAYKGAIGAWLLGRASKSLLLSIDDTKSDFESLDESHYFVLEIYPEQMPEEWITQHRLWMDMQLKSAEETWSRLMEQQKLPSE